jgi:hypothetical protein
MDVNICDTVEVAVVAASPVVGGTAPAAVDGCPATPDELVPASLLSTACFFAGGKSFGSGATSNSPSV